MVDIDDKRVSFVDPNRPFPEIGGAFEIWTNAWWAYVDGKGVVIWKKYHPQCNHDKRISVMLTQSNYPWAEVRQFPLVWLPHRCADY